MPEFLADTSARHRSGATAAIRERWTDLVQSGSLFVTSAVRLELLYSARGPSDYAVLADDLQGLPELPFDENSAQRAEQVQATLAGRSQHRGPTPIDLYVAAVAELHGAILIHYDRHFDAIARVTGQPSEWITPRGTLD